MKQVIYSLAMAAALTPVLASLASAGPISRACMTSGRKAANTSLCGCIQAVADASLTWRDQRVAAKFFKDPHKAQEIRQSDRASDEAFWLRYKAFGTQAERSCQGR
ncbi:hypothetical protein [Marinovum sp.]|uniref:hypothetical protein n=1 Tax=Marinovum sp. TaxID=2024839 RepID=UPI003A906E5B